MSKRHSKQEYEDLYDEAYDDDYDEYDAYDEDDEYENDEYEDDDLDTDERFEEIELEERGRLYARRKRREKQTEKRRRTWKDYLTTGILLIAVCVLCYSLYQLAGIFMEYHEGEKEYEEIQKIAITQQTTEEGTDIFTVDFAALKQKNADTAAWIRFEEPAIINYPVVFNGDNKTYLTKTFEANDNKLGALFIDGNNKPDFTDRNTIIYGHNMKNKTMFAELVNYQDKDYWQAYPYFYIYTPDGKETKYQIYAAGVVSDMAENYQIAFESDEDFQNYIYKTVQSSAYATGVEVLVTSKIVTLSTCTNVRDDERFIVHAVAVSEQMAGGAGEAADQSETADTQQ